MPEAKVVLPLVIFFVVGALTVWLLWRVVVAGGRARRITASGFAAAEIARRAETSLAELLVIVDEVRRRKVAPEDAGANLSASSEALRRYVQEAAALSRSGPWATSAAALVADMERAQRAIDLVTHGAELLAAVSGVDWGEGETSVKRGYLNLVHAREAIRECREQINLGAESRSSAWRD